MIKSGMEQGSRAQFRPGAEYLGSVFILTNAAGGPGFVFVSEIETKVGR